jgi:hypothetical protein
MMIEGSGSGAGAGSIPLTSGSGRPKNMWIRWIRIRNRNTGLKGTIRKFRIVYNYYILFKCKTAFSVCIEKKTEIS